MTIGYNAAQATTGILPPDGVRAHAKQDELVIPSQDICLLRESQVSSMAPYVIGGAAVFLIISLLGKKRK